MNRARHELSPGVILDARRSVYLEEESVLAVADLHFGYAWTHRQRGQLLPLSCPEDTSERLEVLLDEYRPRTLAVLGDIVHGTLPTSEMRKQFQEMLDRLQQRAELRLIAGNHDRLLAREIQLPLVREHRVGPHILLHGDGHSEASSGALHGEALSSGGRLIIGHEHPAISISDRVAHSAKVPCFLAGDCLLVLPAFSTWAAGGNVHTGNTLSHFPAIDPPRKAVAILAGKLLPVRLR